MAHQKKLGEKLAMLVRSSGRTQSDLASDIGMPVSQLNRFLNGHSDLNSSNLEVVLEALGIDLDQMVTARLKRFVDTEEGSELNSTADCVQFLFARLDEIGQQSYLQSLAWAAKVSSKEKLPERVEEILKGKLDLI